MPSHCEDPQSYAVIGACMEVHRQLGHGFLESVYHEALALEFRLRGIPYERECQVTVAYKGCELNSYFMADYISYGELLVELKALASLTGSHHAQVLNYLKATGLQKGLLVNFGAPSLEWRRFVFTPPSNTTPSDGVECD